MFVYWKGHIEPVVSDALLCQMDFPASIAKLIDATVPEGLDSQELLNTLLGKSKEGRKDLILEAQGKLAIREGDWIAIPPYSGPKTNLTGNELGNLPEWGLFNTVNDPGQQTNVAASEPEILKKLQDNFFEQTKGYYQEEVEEVELQ